MIVYVCLSLCVCLSAVICSELHVLSLVFFCLLPVAVARSSSGGVNFWPWFEHPWPRAALVLTW